MYRSIMVPLDGSRAAEHALPLAISIARRAGATLQLAHVHNPARPMFMDAVPLVDDPRDGEHREGERTYLDALAGRLMQHDKLTITTRLLEGATADTIAFYALASCVDLVVMTTHGRSTQTHVWLGPVADELVRWPLTPLLLIRPRDDAPDLAHEPGCRQMLVVFDGSASFEQHLAHAVALGTLLGAEYTLLQVVEPVRAADRTTFDSRQLAQQRRQAQAHLDQIAARLRAEALRVRAHVAIGEPARAILDYTGTHAIDMIAMQTHVSSGVEQLLRGSVAEQVLRGTPVPLLLDRPQIATSRTDTGAERELSGGSGF